MNDEKLEQMLNEIYSQDIAPSERLIQKIKHRVSVNGVSGNRVPKNRFTEYLIALVVSFNLAGFLAFIGFISAAPYGLLYKVMLYMAISCVYNSLALAAYLYKDRVNGFFQKL